MLAILDYKAGNQTSVRRALEHLGIPCAITADPATLESAHGIIFPGVGAAGQAMRALHPTGLDNLLRDAVKRGQPLLGICLGCQILLDRSEENDTKTLGIVPGLCRRCDDNMVEEDGTPAPIPHMGWNDLVIDHRHPVLEGVATGDHAYFVHSYHFRAADPAHRLAHVDYAGEVTAIVGRDTIFGTQFHPEKSSATGLRIIANFLTWRP